MKPISVIVDKQTDRYINQLNCQKRFFSKYMGNSIQ